jgi:Fur family zinc uptake transcriptional regulator
MQKGKRPPASSSATLLARAEAITKARGARLTALRREVLQLVLEAGAPIGAYDLLAALRLRHARAAPPTVYRALDFLLEQGLIHRIARLSAFIGCIGHEAGHAAQFLICRRCGQVLEIDAAEVTLALAQAAQRFAFMVAGATIEAEGLCATCALRA